MQISHPYPVTVYIRDFTKDTLKELIVKIPFYVILKSIKIGLDKKTSFATIDRIKGERAET